MSSEQAGKPAKQAEPFTSQLAKVFLPFFSPVPSTFFILQKIKKQKTKEGHLGK